MIDMWWIWQKINNTSLTVGKGLTLVKEGICVDFREKEEQKSVSVKELNLKMF